MPDGSAEGKIITTMSLDLYIYSHRPVRHQGTGVFVRDNGQTRELKTIDEVRQHFPDADLSDIHVIDYEDNELFHLNLTHNLTEMASHVPIAGTDGHLTLPQDYERDKPDFTPKPLSAYNLLWHPETNPLLEQTTIHRKDTADGGEKVGEVWVQPVTRITPELVRQVMAVSFYITHHRDELTPYNSDNGWGTYEQLRDRTRNLLLCLLEIPAEEYDQYCLYCWT